MIVINCHSSPFSLPKGLLHVPAQYQIMNAHPHCNKSINLSQSCSCMYVHAHADQICQIEEKVIEMYETSTERRKRMSELVVYKWEPPSGEHFM